VVDQEDLAGPQQTLRDRQRPDLVVRYHPARVPDDVRVALLEPQYPVDVELASMQATTATPLAGGSGRSPLSKEAAYPSLFLDRSSVTLFAFHLSLVRHRRAHTLVERSEPCFRIAWGRMMRRRFDGMVYRDKWGASASVRRQQ
jgi:hypothetical protein